MRQPDMNLRQWGRAIHTRIANQTVEPHHRQISAADIETILRQSIEVLAETISQGEELRLRDLGRFWIEGKASRQIVSNLPGQQKQYDLGGRRILRFQASAGLVNFIYSAKSPRGCRTRRNR